MTSKTEPFLHAVRREAAEARLVLTDADCDGCGEVVKTGKAVLAVGGGNGKLFCIRCVGGSHGKMVNLMRTNKTL
jgi:formylmethanofuran dehydrogenase subunit E